MATILNISLLSTRIEFMLEQLYLVQFLNVTLFHQIVLQNLRLINVGFLEL